VKQGKRIKPRKEPVQRRSIELRKAILQAATYVLRKEGLLGFNTNRIAERAGVNIASFYQYYPDKESLLFHLVEIEWNETSKVIFEILEDESKTHRERLSSFIEKFFESEVQERSLNEAIAGAGLLLENTKEYQSLLAEADRRFFRFLSGALGKRPGLSIQSSSELIQGLIFGFAERGSRKDWKTFHEDARHIECMICDYFGIE